MQHRAAEQQRAERLKVERLKNNFGAAVTVSLHPGQRRSFSSTALPQDASGSSA